MQPQEGLRDRRSLGDEIMQFGPRHLNPTQQRITKRRPHLLRRPVNIIASQHAEVGVIDLRQPQQHRSCQRALITLDQVQIADRYTQIIGHAGLCQPKLKPEPPEARSGIKFTVKGEGGHLCVFLQNDNLSKKIPDM